MADYSSVFLLYEKLLGLMILRALLVGYENYVLTVSVKCKQKCSLNVFKLFIAGFILSADIVSVVKMHYSANTSF